MKKYWKVSFIFLVAVVAVGLAVPLISAKPLAPGEDQTNLFSSGPNGRNPAVAVIQDNVVAGYGFANFSIKKDGGEMMYLRTDLKDAGTPLSADDPWAVVLEKVGQDYPNNIVCVSVPSSGIIKLKVLDKYAQGKMYIINQTFPEGTSAETISKTVGQGLTLARL